MKNQSKFLVLGILALALTGCGPNLTGSFSGSQQQINSMGQMSYRAQLQLNQDGDKVRGTVISTVNSSQSTSTGSMYPGAQGYLPVSGQLEGTVNGDVLQNVRLTVLENGCSVVYQGSFNISNGNRLQGVLISAGTTSSGGSTSCYSSSGSSSFDVSK